MEYEDNKEIIIIILNRICYYKFLGNKKKEINNVNNSKNNKIEFLYDIF